MNIYRKFFKKYAFFLIISIVIGGSLGITVTRLLPESYDVSLAIDIERKPSPNTDFYTYDGYYAIQATELFGKSVASWFVTPDFVEDILQNANKSDIEDLSVKDFRTIFSPEQISANIVEVGFQVKEAEIGATLTEAISTSITEYIERRSIQDYSIQVGNPVIRQTQYNPLFFSLGGIILAFAIGVAIAGIKEYYWKK